MGCSALVGPVEAPFLATIGRHDQFEANYERSAQENSRGVRKDLQKRLALQAMNIGMPSVLHAAS